MIALVDTNVVLDVLLNRKPFVQASAAVLTAVETGRIRGLLGATSVTTIHYLLEKYLSSRAARNAVASLLTLFEVAPITRLVLEAALKSKLKDFEDAVLEQAALASGATVIVTRNQRDFSGSIVRAYGPEVILKLL